MLRASSSRKRVADCQTDDTSEKKAKRELHPLFSKESDKPSKPTVFKWIKGPNKTLLHGTNLNPKCSTKVAAFDLDGTIILGSFWSKETEGQWKWWNPAVPSRLKALHDDGYSVVIVSNQALNPAPMKAWEDKKIPSIAAALQDVPFRIFGAKAKDQFRKPMPGMWYELENIFGKDGIEIDKSASFCVGDAAGREKDFASSDRKWADNVGIRFSTPEEYFLGEVGQKYTLQGFNVSSMKKLPLYTPTNIPLIPTCSESTKPQTELILFVGYPCLGKSSFYRRHLEPAGYKHINQDTLRTRDKCVREVERALLAGESCVVDNTNRNVQTRKYYLDVAQKLGIQVRCFIFAGNADLAWHNNLYRAYNMPPSAPRIDPRRDLLPYSAIAGFTKDYEAPTTSEGFSEIKTVNWVFEGDAEAKRRWSMWLQLDDKIKKK
ncbi:hypothetical protein PILCRDRAFT_16074 [Piloderma croceum F 1598]|uniref:PNK FHA domain-containing protein n=1 Tax=Piloderma croceum (strain F 1598) TaxID=765440 RepID=A0A0C3B5D9_PILCF|nr:hypothetical protein PILCRDRAFT_16074 [Piloderma croceum F 1598]